MDELIKTVQSKAGQADALTLVEVVIALLLCLICTVAIAVVYRKTNNSASYSQSYVKSLILMGLVTTIIMIVIGSNIARAFSLVGALSIIRFRNAIKETHDVAYIFFAMAIAMACGTRFYLIALVTTGIICAVMTVLYLTNFGDKRAQVERLLTIHVPPGRDPKQLLTPVLEKYFDSWALIALESVRQGLYLEAIYSVSPKPDANEAEVIDAITRANDNLKVTYSFNSGTDAV